MHPPPAVAEPVKDGAYKCLLYHSDIITGLPVAMDDPPPPEPAPPSPTTCLCCAAQGKAPAESRAAPAGPLVPSAGPSKGKKCHVETPESESPNDNIFFGDDGG